MQRTERCFRLFRIGYAVVYQIFVAVRMRESVYDRRQA